MTRYKVIRMYFIDAVNPQDAMARAGEHDLAWQKAVVDDDDGSWMKTAKRQIKGR